MRGTSVLTATTTTRNLGRSNVELHAVATTVALGNAGEAIDLAEGIDASGLSPKRQASCSLTLRALMLSGATLVRPSQRFSRRSV